MVPQMRDTSASETNVTLTVRYWASIRAAAGCSEELVEVPVGTSLAELVTLLAARHGEEFARVCAVCSVLLDDEPVGRRDPATVELAQGLSVEFLPPFAGG